MREKIIDGLKHCIERNMECKWEDNDCPYVEECKKNPVLDLKQDALHAIEAHLVTDEDFEEGDRYGWIPVWTQTRTDLYCECVTKEMIDHEYEYPVRMWVGKPTQEQLDEWEIENEEDS